MLPVLLLGSLPLPSVQEAWTPLPLPGVCHPSPEVEAPYEILDANHLPTPDDLRGAPEAPEAPVSATLLLQLVEEELRARRADARLEIVGDRMLVQGPDQAVSIVREVFTGLERLERSLTVEVAATLSGPGAPPQTWTGVARSGERLAFGERRATSYLGSQDVNVASDSGVAEPETHRALTGRTLHVTVSRLSSGRSLIEGTLDLAELVALESYDPDTPDLGELQLPRVATTQVRFAGIDRATVTLAGPPDPALPTTLVVTARVAPPGSAGGAWVGFDLAALATRPPGLERVDPGELGVQRVRSSPRATVGFDPGTLAVLVEDRGKDAGPALWGGRLLFLRSDAPAAERARQLIAALEAELVPGTLSVRHGTLHASFPVVEGRRARLVAGTEQRFLTDVGSQLAPSTWMAEPVIERTFDGLVLTGVPRGVRFTGDVRVTTGTLLDTLPRSTVGLAAMQRLERGRRGGSVAVDSSAAEDTELLGTTPGAAAVLARFDR